MYRLTSTRTVETASSQAFLWHASIEALSSRDCTPLGPKWALEETTWPAAVPAVTFAAFLDSEVSAGLGFLRFEAFCQSEVSLAPFGDGERNETGLASPSNVADRSVRGVKAGEEATAYGCAKRADPE